MKVLFLDIDGVLNSAKFFKARKEEAEWDAQVERFESFAPTDIEKWATVMIDPDAAHLLFRLLAEHQDLRIVISSSWREAHPIGRIREIFEFAGHIVIAERIIDRTDISSGAASRAELITAWVDRFYAEITEWAALDDITLEGIEERHVKTTWATGLQPAHIAKLRELLK
jgi:hypothetical protein